MLHLDTNGKLGKNNVSDANRDSKLWPVVYFYMIRVIITFQILLIRNLFFFFYISS